VNVRGGGSRDRLGQIGSVTRKDERPIVVIHLARRLSRAP
jgi:hypothetical protein